MDFSTTARRLMSYSIFANVLCKEVVIGTCNTLGSVIPACEMCLE